MAEPIKVPFGGVDLCRTKEPCVRWGHGSPRGRDAYTQTDL